MIAPLTLRAGCKINLYLHVGAKRADGFHDLESLFLPLEEPHDRLEIRPLADEPEGRVLCSFFKASQGNEPLLDIDPERNTLTRAAAWHAEQSGFNPALEIRVYKGIPHGAGLGGGSSDAAALLLWLREQARLAKARLAPFPRFLEAAAGGGADVPFFLRKTPALVTGLGEKLCPAVNPHAGHSLLLLCPNLAISTAWAFAALDRYREEQGGPHGGLPEFAKKNLSCGLTVEASRATPSFARTPGRGNDFEAIVFAAYPELARLHGRLIQSGALEARMSGTGSSLFALYREAEIARLAAKELAKEGCSVYIQRLPEGSPTGWTDAGV